MELYWRQLPLAWLAFHPDHAEELGDPLTRPVDAPTRDLCARLLALGGTRVAVQFADAGVCWLILRDGEAVGPEGLILRPGRGNHCHTNSSAAWASSRRTYSPFESRIARPLHAATSPDSQAPRRRLASLFPGWHAATARLAAIRQIRIRMRWRTGTVG